MKERCPNQSNQAHMKRIKQGHLLHCGQDRRIIDQDQYNQEPHKDSIDID